MNLTTFLQAIISLVFIYLILSLLTSELQEYLATVFEARAKRLKQSIRQMLGEQDYPYYRLECSDELKKDDWIWLQDGKINKINGITTSPVADIFIKESDHSVIQKTDAIEEPQASGKFYVKGQPVTKLPVYQGNNNTKCWSPSVTPINDQTKLTSDQHIWIKDSDGTEVNEADVNPNGLTSDKGIMKFDNSSHVTKYPVYSEVADPTKKVWIKPQDIQQINSLNTSTDVLINQTDNSLVNETEIITISNPPNQATYYIKGESVTKLPSTSVTQILKNPSENPIYLWDDDKSNILDGNNITVKLATFSPKPESETFSFLIDKLYEHPNIQALNQSSFGWWSLFLSIIINGKALIIVIVLFLVSIILLILPVWQNWPLLGFGFSILPLLVLVCLYLQNEDKYGTVRKSIGPSYIEDPGLFAQTLISVIKDNSNDPQNSTNFASTLEQLKFYTPAQRILIEMLKFSDGIESGFKILLEQQYKNTQQRSSGSYKRNSKGLSFLVGLLIAILCNADTFNMIANLTKEGNTTAEQLVTALDKQDPTFFEGCKQDDIACQNQKNEKLKSIFNSIDSFPLGWSNGLQKQIEELKLLNDTKTFFKDKLNSVCNLEDNKITPESSTTCLNKTEKLLVEFPDNVNHLTPSFLTIIQNIRKPNGEIDNTKVVEIPKQYSAFLDEKQNEIGLKQQEIIALIKSNSPTSTKEIAQQIHNTVNSQGGWIKVPLGWLITAIALSMGAPFWFDQLNRIMNVRNAGKSNGS